VIGRNDLVVVREVDVVQAHTRLEILDDVVQLEILGLLRVIRGAGIEVILRVGVFAEDLELADADDLRKQVTREPVPAVALVRGVAAEMIVLRILGFDRDYAPVGGQLFLKEKICSAIPNASRSFSP
jgi:hypothetical protein